MTDLWETNSCSTNGASVDEEGVFRYYFKRKFKNDMKDKVKDDIQNSMNHTITNILLI